MGLSGVVAFSRVRPRDRWVHPGSLGSLALAIEFFLCSLACVLGVVGFMLGCTVPSCAP